MAQKYALLVGNSFFLDENLMRLKCPDVDVGSLVEILMDRELGGFDDVKSLTNVGSGAVRKAIADLFNRKMSDDLLLLYFSGHGIMDEQGRLYLAVKDTERNLLSGTAIPANFITDEMNNSRSKRQVLILDCCHSGAFSRGSKGSTGASVCTAVNFEGTGYGRVVLTATDSTQFAWEGDRVIGKAENSLFTHFLIQGLRTGEADINKDGQVTVDELYDYIYTQVVRSTPQQTPGKWSYKEQGEIVISRTPGKGYRQIIPDAPPVSSEVLEKEAEHLYTQGLSAFWLENWDKAIQNLQAFLQFNPNSADAESKLKEARKQAKLRDGYLKAQIAIQQEDWQAGVDLLEILVNETPDYKDAAQQLATVRKKMQLAELYSQTQRLYQAQEWEAAIKVLSEISAIEPGYPDPDGILESSKNHIAEIERQKEIAQILHHALDELNVHHLYEAQKHLQKLLELEPDHEEASLLVVKIADEIKREEEQQQKAAQVAALYAKVAKLTGTHQWRQVLELCKQIQVVEPNYRDVKELVEKAEAEGKKEQDEAKRQAELAALYAESVRLLRNGQYSQALEHWKKIQERDATYPDPMKVQQTCQRKLAALIAPQPLVKILRINRKWGIFALVVCALLILIIIAWRVINLNPLTMRLLATIKAPVTALDTAVPTKDATLEALASSNRTVQAGKTVQAKNTIQAVNTIQAENTAQAEKTKTLKFGLLLTTTSDWTTVHIKSVNGNLDIFKTIWIEGNLTESFHDVTPQQRSINIIQPIDIAQAGNTVSAEYEIPILYQVEGWSHNPIQISIEKGAIGQTSVELFDMKGFGLQTYSSNSQWDEAVVLANFVKDETDQRDITTFTLDSFDLWNPPDFNLLRRVSINLGEKNEPMGLFYFPDSGDGLTKAISIGSKSALSSIPNGTPGRFIYFFVDPFFSIFKKPGHFNVIVEYYDHGEFEFSVDYDSADSTLGDFSSYKPSTSVKLTNSMLWKTATFDLPDAYFRNRQHNQADFRVCAGGDKDLIINRVIVIAP